MNNIFNPSFEIERKTKAFNKYICFFVCIISCFTISVFLLAFYAFMTFFLKIVDYSSWLQFISLTPLTFLVITSYQLYLFFNSLLTSYKLENGNLIKGKILNKDKVNFNDISVLSSLLRDELTIFKSNSSISADNFARNLYEIVCRIECNLKLDFVTKYFDTELYKKTIYNNAKLIGETKYSLIYTSDNKKKIVVPKIYNGMCNIDNTNNVQETSFVKRIIKKSIFVFLFTLIFIICLLCFQNKENVNALNSISNTTSNILQKLDDFGYSISNSGTAYYIYSKELDSTKKSTIKYVFKSDGSIASVNIQLYYNDKSSNVENELYAILDTTNYEFVTSEKEEFIENVIKSINGNYTYDKLSSGKFSIRIGTSEGYIDIH